MTGFFWHIFIFSVLFIFIVLMFYRVLSIVRLPVHLRWELAPIPHEKGRSQYGDSYLEEYEWWQKKRRKSFLAVIIYMAGEIFLQKGVWKNNRGLWPFTITMHMGIYFVIISIVLHIINALFIITGAPTAVFDVFKTIAAVFALTGYIMGSLGAIGLVLKRCIDTNFRAYGTFPVYFRLLFLAAIFISGIIAWFSSNDFATETSVFTRNLFVLDSGITATVPLAVHIIIASLFLIYLPLTDMVHFITKYFTYHAVRWNDMPLDKEMEIKLRRLVSRPVNWSAPHIKSGRTWAEIATEEKHDEKTP